jgi:hypothetical protein
VTPFSMVEACDYGSEGCVFESRRVHVLELHAITARSSPQ